MKKYLKLGKRMIALFIVVLLNINSYAAVGGNDGSAFVTKAEFDAVVNTFNEQMDNYENGVVSKVDGAIANYLAGLSSTSTTTVSILTPSWTEVSAFNGTIAPTFTIPKLDISYGGGVKGYHSWSTYYYKRYSMEYNMRYTYTSNNNNTRALVKCNVSENQQSASGAKFAWDGVENKYRESWSINAGINNNSGGDLHSVETTYAKSFRVENGININLSNGYISNLSTLTTVINPTIYYTCNGNTNTLSFPTKSVNTVAEIETSDRTYQHIIQYNGTTSWCVSEPSFTKTVRTHTASNVTSNIMSSVSKTASGSVTCYAGDTRNGIYQGSSTSISYTHTTQSAVKYPSVGMLSSDKAANTILQTLDDISYEYANKKGKLQDIKLHVGLPILAAAKDSTIKWSPRFTQGKAWSSAQQKWVDSTATRVKLLLSVGEFTDKIASTNIIEAESPVGKTTDGGVLCNICKQASDVATEISFKMPKDGVVYAKWVPDTGSYDSDNWIQPINLSQSNTYPLITE